MPDSPAAEIPGEPIAIVGLACRFPDAAHPAEFLELFLTGRRAFRRLPPVRLDLAEYGEPGPLGVPGLGVPGQSGPGLGGPPVSVPASEVLPAVRAGLVEGWRFDRATFGVTEPAYRAADPAHWLALETAARALADSGFPGGQGLTRDRTGVVIGNTLTGDVSRAFALRSRWPYVRRVISSALTAGEVPPEAHAGVIGHAAAGFLAPFPGINDDSLAGSLPGAIADRICGHFGFRGGGHAVDSAHSSSLLAVAAACSALAAGDLDAAVAGGVDISLDPFELAGLARTGELARSEMRVFDARPTGFWPGEGCGLVVLMRAADARAAGVPTYAEIAGWGVSSAGNPALTKPGSGGLLLAMRRAYQRAGIDPADVQLIEGDGTGTGSGDLAELTSLAEIREGASSLAALGSVKANMGHAKAAAGAAGLIKTTLAVAAGVLPPITGCVRPHPLITSEDARLRILRTAEAWPDGTRLAAVSAVGPGGTSVHMIVRRDTRGGRRRRAPGAARLTGAGGGHRRGSGWGPAALAVAGTPRTEAYVFSGPDRHALARELSRIADLAPWLSDGEMHDLACQAGRRPGEAGSMRVALVASTQDQLAGLAREAVTLLNGLRPGRLSVSPGIFAADSGHGRVALLFPGEGAQLGVPSPRAMPGGVGSYDPVLQPAIFAASLAGLRWLEKLGVVATAGVGHGLGEITGLVWAGSLSEPDAARLVSQRGALLAAPSAQRAVLVSVDADAATARALCEGSDLAVAADNGPRCQIVAGPASAARDLTRKLAQAGVPARILDSPHGFYSRALADRVPPLRSVLQELSFRPPVRRLLSTVTGAEIGTGDDLVALLSAQLTSPVRFAGPLVRAASDADLLVETGPGCSLSLLAADCCGIPAVSLGAGRTDEDPAAQVVAALFAVGAVRSLAPLFSGRAARLVDIWRERVFIASPCGTAPPAGTTAAGVGIPGGGASEIAVGQAALTAAPGGAGRETAAAARAGGGSPALGTRAEAPAATPGQGERETADPATPDGGSPAPEARTSAPAPTTGTSAPTATGSLAVPAAHTPGAPSAPGSAAATRSGPAATRPRSQAARTPRDQGTGMQGVGPWVRCFTEELRPAQPPTSPASVGPWRLRTATRQAFGMAAAGLFEDDPGADQVLAVIGDPADPGACATLLDAVREAADAGRLIVITSVDGLTGFCATAHAEHPSLGVTLIRAPESRDGLRAARRFATAVPGEFREILLEEAGTARTPAMVVSEPAGDGTFPLGPADVVLVSGLTRLGDLACAAALAGRGSALAVIAPPGPEDPRLAAYLAQLRAAGTRMSRKKADPGDPGQVAAAVRSLERGLGPVTAVIHAAGTGPIERCARLPESTVRAHVVSQRIRLGNLLGAVAMERLRLLVTFGQVSARYGAAEGACGALASGLLAAQASAQASRLAAGPGCRALHVDLPPWADQDPGTMPHTPTAATRQEQVMPIPVADGSRLLLNVLATPGFPGRLAIHGRVGVPAPPAIGRGAAATPRGRFVAAVQVHYPGTELVADTRLSLASDPYLADHRIDGLPVLPVALALEAMAQAASALAGKPQLHLTGVSVPAPVVLPADAGRGEAVIRVSALRNGGSVETVLRCGETGFRVDHARATFHAGVGLPAEPGATRAAPGSSRAGHPPVGFPGSTGAGGTPAGPLPPRPGGDGTPPGADGTPPGADGTPPGGIVDGTDLYGPVNFQTGRFRRVAFLPEVTSRTCRALVRGGDDQPWFGAVPGPVDAPLVLGSPGLNDATSHVLQACVPHRRLLVAGCESLTVSGREVRGAVQVRAVRRPGAADGAWDVTATDATGQLIVAWAGLRLRGVGPLAAPAAWHPALLATHLEGRAAELGLDQELRAAIRCDWATPGPAPDLREPVTGTQAPGARPLTWWTWSATGTGSLDGLGLYLRASKPVTCHWQAAGPPQAAGSFPGAGEDGGPGGRPCGQNLTDRVPRIATLAESAADLLRFGRVLLARPGERASTVSARLQAVAACLASSPWQPGTPLAIDDAFEGGWVRVQAGTTTVACTVVEIAGVPSPVALSMATWPADGPAPIPPRGTAGQSAAAAANGSAP
jgi:enediyne polyketide synthase